VRSEQDIKQYRDDITLCVETFPRVPLKEFTAHDMMRAINHALCWTLGEDPEIKLPSGEMGPYQNIVDACREDAITCSAELELGDILDEMLGYKEKE
jgi:hypothetical protein